MSYTKKIEYRVKPLKSYEILRNCSGCGGKTVFTNTNRFRVNANGNKVDVWLIYQCSKCRHTYNVTIYERQKPGSIPSEEFLGFQNNSPELAFRYGTDSGLFKKNKAEIDWSRAEYTYELLGSNLPHTLPAGSEIIVYNDYCLKLRSDKILSELLGLSRSRLKNLLDNEIISVTEHKQDRKTEINIRKELLL